METTTLSSKSARFKRFSVRVAAGCVLAVAATSAVGPLAFADGASGGFFKGATADDVEKMVSDAPAPEAPLLRDGQFLGVARWKNEDNKIVQKQVQVGTTRTQCTNGWRDFFSGWTNMCHDGGEPLYEARSELRSQEVPSTLTLNAPKGTRFVPSNEVLTSSSADGKALAKLAPFTGCQFVNEDRTKMSCVAPQNASVQGKSFLFVHPMLENMPGKTASANGAAELLGATSSVLAVKTVGKSTGVTSGVRSPALSGLQDRIDDLLTQLSLDKGPAAGAVKAPELRQKLSTLNDELTKLAKRGGDLKGLDPKFKDLAEQLKRLTGQFKSKPGSVDDAAKVLGPALNDLAAAVKGANADGAGLAPKFDDLTKKIQELTQPFANEQALGDLEAKLRQLGLEWDSLVPEKQTEERAAVHQEAIDAVQALRGNKDPNRFLALQVDANNKLFTASLMVSSALRS